jgi:hypothetical protein
VGSQNDSERPVHHVVAAVSKGDPRPWGNSRGSSGSVGEIGGDRRYRLQTSRSADAGKLAKGSAAI